MNDENARLAYVHEGALGLLRDLDPARVEVKIVRTADDVPDGVVVFLSPTSLRMLQKDRALRDALRTKEHEGDIGLVMLYPGGQSGGSEKAESGLGDHLERWIAWDNSPTAHTALWHLACPETYRDLGALSNAIVVSILRAVGPRGLPREQVTSDLVLANLQDRAVSDHLARCPGCLDAFRRWVYNGVHNLAGPDGIVRQVRTRVVNVTIISRGNGSGLSLDDLFTLLFGRDGDDKGFDRDSLVSGVLKAVAENLDQYSAEERLQLGERFRNANFTAQHLRNAGLNPAEFGYPPEGGPEPSAQATAL